MDKHKKVSNLLSKETCDILAGYLLMKEDRADYDKNFSDIDVPGAYHGYCDPVLDALLFYLKPRMEKEVGFELYPTYSYFRIYRNGHALHKHTDRKSCEISVTLNLKNDGVPWPIIIEGEDIHLDQGDGAIYNGVMHKHHRRPFDGEEYIQTFLHYVKADGEYSHFKHDKRIDLFDPF